MSSSTVYRFRICRELDSGDLAPVLDPENGLQMGAAGLNEERARIATMEDADALADVEPDTEFVVLDPAGLECYRVAPGASVPF